MNSDFFYCTNSDQAGMFEKQLIKNKIQYNYLKNLFEPNKFFFNIIFSTNNPKKLMEENIIISDFLRNKIIFRKS
jgi:hypothetical protein